MSKMVNSLQGVYAPLPQSLSDSDSEKEITMEPVCTNYNMKMMNSNYHQNGDLQLNDDVIKIKRGTGKMGTLRKVMFVVSILLIFLLIGVFLWVLPCSELNTCPVRISNWEYEQDDVELNGNIHVVSGLYKLNKNLAVLYEGGFSNAKGLKNGIISFMGHNGAVAWDFQQEVRPYKMNCSLIDVDKNGNNDCLVTDVRGLKAIETISGEALWHAHSAEEKRPINDLDFPEILQDFNSDGVNELIAIYKHESLLVISGQTGRAIANIKIPQCKNVTNLETVHETVLFDCKNGSELVSYELSFADVFFKLSHPKHKAIFRKIQVRKVDFEYVSGDRKLFVNNSGNCPNCESFVNLLDKNGSSMKKWSYRNCFVMSPKPFAFKSSRDNLTHMKGHVNGFIVKIWQWPVRGNVSKRSIPTQNHRSMYLDEVTERVVLITFNETNIHNINASLKQITRMCYAQEDGSGGACQPDYRRQKDSLLVVDLDGDGSVELVSYYSSYVRKGDGEWHLVSFLGAIRLEDEMPKLYGSK